MGESDQTVSAGRLVTGHFAHPDIANTRKYPAALMNEAAWIGEDRAVFIYVLLKMGMLPPAYPLIDLKKEKYGTIYIVCTASVWPMARA